MAQLPSTLKSIGIDLHINADDTQLWVSFRPKDELSKFMTVYNLQLNADMTQFLPIFRLILSLQLSLFQ